MGSTSIYKLPWPELPEAADGPDGYQKLAEAVETALITGVPRRVLSTARPTSSYAVGDQILETDTGRRATWDGAQWIYSAPWKDYFVKFRRSTDVTLAVAGWNGPNWDTKVFDTGNIGTAAGGYLTAPRTGRMRFWGHVTLVNSGTAGITRGLAGVWGANVGNPTATTQWVTEQFEGAFARGSETYIAGVNSGAGTNRTSAFNVEIPVTQGLAYTVRYYVAAMTNVLQAIGSHWSARYVD